MNPKATTPDAICAACRKIVQEKGLTALSIRAAAKAAGVAPTTIYTYFPDKEALLLAVTASIWKEIFSLDSESSGDVGFPSFVEQLFLSAREGLARYPGFLSGHALGLSSGAADACQGRREMHAFFSSLEQRMLAVLESDPDVRRDAFDAELTCESFCGLVLEQLLFQLVSGHRDCRALLAVIGRVIY